MIAVSKRWVGLFHLCHGLAEAEVLEQFNPDREESNGNKIVILRLPVRQVIELSIHRVVSQQSLLESGELGRHTGRRVLTSSLLDTSWDL